MADKSTPDPTTFINTTAQAVTEAAGKASEQYLSLLEQSQSAALDGYKTVVDAMGKIDIPAVPGLDAVVSGVESLNVPVTALDGAFDFAAKLVENQKEFVHKMLAVSAKD